MGNNERVQNTAIEMGGTLKKTNLRVMAQPIRGMEPAPAIILNPIIPGTQAPNRPIILSP